MCRTFPGLLRRAESRLLAGADGIASSSVLNKSGSTPSGSEPTVLSETSHSPVRAPKLHRLHCSTFYIHTETKHKSDTWEKALVCRSLSPHSNTAASTPINKPERAAECARAEQRHLKTQLQQTRNKTFSEINI